MVLEQEQSVPAEALSGSDPTPEDKAGKIARNKWGEALDAGFQIIPDVLFRAQRILGLEAIDVVILLNITTHWWEYDDLPYPRPSIIAKRMKVSTRTVERRIAELQKNGFLTRLPSQLKHGKTVRPYDLTGLVQKLRALSIANLVMRRSQAAPVMGGRQRRQKTH
jgi:hypothetical protein